MVGLSGKEEVSLSSLAPGAPEYMTVQNGQMHLPLLEVTAESFLSLLFSVSCVIDPWHAFWRTARKGAPAFIPKLLKG